MLFVLNICFLQSCMLYNNFFFHEKQIMKYINNMQLLIIPCMRVPLTRSMFWEVVKNRHVGTIVHDFYVTKAWIGFSVLQQKPFWQFFWLCWLTARQWIKYYLCILIPDSNSILCRLKSWKVKGIIYRYWRILKAT